MGNSIEYIKGRIKSGDARIAICKFDSMYEMSPYEVLEIKDTNEICETTSSGKIISEVYYDENAEFNYFTMSRNQNDGTLLFMRETVKEVLEKVLRCETYNVDILKEIPDDEEYFKKHHFKYTIGNIVCCSEHGDEFSTKEKPWMKSRFTALLPIKFEIVE